MADHKLRIIARFISTIGHPAVVTPGSILLLTRRFGFSPPLIGYLMTVIVIAAGLMLWSLIKVRLGQWGHIDASEPGERVEWNKAAFILLVASALIAGRGQADILGLGLGCCAFIIGASICASGFLKMSQHVAFATFSIFIARIVGPGEAAGLSVLTVAVGWSRIVLGRHTRIEVIAGAATGILAGLGLALGLPTIN